MALQATKFSLAGKAAVQQEKLCRLRLCQEAKSVALFDASISIQQLKLRECFASYQLGSSRCFSSLLSAALRDPTPPIASGGAIIVRPSEVEIFFTATTITTRGVYWCKCRMLDRAPFFLQF